MKFRDNLKLPKQISDTLNVCSGKVNRLHTKKKLKLHETEICQNFHTAVTTDFRVLLYEYCLPGKISAFHPHFPNLNSRPCRVLNICVTFFSAKVDSAFHPYGVGRMSTSFCWGLTCDGLVSRPGGVNDSHPLNTTETGDKCQLQQATWLGKGFSSTK